MKRLLLGLCCLTSCATAGAEWAFDAAAGFTYDDNLSNSLEADDRKADKH